MPKRFTDTEKWKKPWFRSLSPTHKCFWTYLCDNCDHAGIWYVDFELAEMMIKAELNTEEIKKLFAKQILSLNEGKKWLIKDFVSFQYGKLNPANKCHYSIISILKKEGAIKGLSRGYQAPKDKDKDKDKDKKGGMGENINNKFDIFWQTYPKKKSKGKAEIAFKKINPGEQFLATMLAKIEQAKTSVEWIKEHGQFIPYPATWLNAKGWEDIFIQPEEGKEVEYLFCENCNISLPEEITKCPGCKSDKHLKKRVMRKYGTE